MAVRKPLPELLFDDKSNIDTSNWDEYIEEVICLCANAAFAKQYTHFSLQSFSKCYSGPNVAETYNKDGKSSSCAGRGGNPSEGKYESCASPDLVCVGKEQANYVYGLANGRFNENAIKIMKLILSFYPISPLSALHQ